MLLESNKKRRGWRYLTQAIFGVVLCAVIFSPFQPLLTVPVVHAAATTPPTATTPATPPIVTEKEETGCGVTELDLCIANIIYAFTVGLGSIFAWLAAIFLSLAVGISLQGPTYAIDFIAEGWTVVRDVANMFFILILIYIAFVLMFKAETSGTMHTLVWVILIALLINFSFFATRVVIDIGNILAVQFYNLIPTSVTIPGTQTKDLTQALMEGIGMQKAFSTAAFTTFASQAGFLTTIITLGFIYISVGIMLFMLAATFLMVGVKFLVRVVILWICIIAAPAALVMLAFPTKATRAIYGKWQNNLILHVFYPAVFLFVFYILSLFMTSVNAGGGSLLEGIFANLADEIKPTMGLGSMVILGKQIATIAIRLGFVIVILYLGLRISEQMGVYGATAARGFAGWGTRKMSNIGYGGASLAARMGVGAAGFGAKQLSRAAGRNPILVDAMRNGNIGERGGAKAILAATKGLSAALNSKLVQDRSYDPRTLPGMRKKTGRKDKDGNDIYGPGMLAKALNTTDYGLGKVGFDVGKGGTERLERTARAFMKQKDEARAPWSTLKLKQAPPKSTVEDVADVDRMKEPRPKAPDVEDLVQGPDGAWMSRAAADAAAAANIPVIIPITTDPRFTAEPSPAPEPQATSRPTPPPPPKTESEPAPDRTSSSARSFAPTNSRVAELLNAKPSTTEAKETPATPVIGGAYIPTPHGGEGASGLQNAVHKLEQQENSEQMKKLREAVNKLREKIADGPLVQGETHPEEKPRGAEGSKPRQIPPPEAVIPPQLSQTFNKTVVVEKTVNNLNTTNNLSAAEPTPEKPLPPPKNNQGGVV